ncbi:MAG: alpha/beta hydrolase [bacterium]
MIRELVESFVFQPTRRLEWTPADLALAYEDVWLRTADGVRIHGWWVPAGRAAPVLLFCHGNAGNIGDRVGNVRLLHDAGISVLIFDYRGYGRSEGKPSEAGVYADAHAAWDWLTAERGVPVARVSLFGRSLGGAVAIELATHVTPHRLIVESTFTSIPDMVPLALPFVPRALVPRLFDSIGRIGRVSCPVLVLHGTRDELVPFEMGRSLYAEIRSAKRFAPIEGAGHNDTVDVGGAPYIATLRELVSEP